MKSFWMKFATVAVKAAIWACDNHDTVIAIVNAVKAAQGNPNPK